MGAGCLREFSVPKYYLLESVDGRFAVELEKADFEKYSGAVENVNLLGAIQSSYAIAAKSFAGLERYLSDCAIFLWIEECSPSDIPDFFTEYIETCSLKLLTILNAYSAYLDHTPQRLSQIAGPNSALLNNFTEYCREQYDSNPDYRLFSCLRNYAQHKSLPVHGSSYGQTRLYENKKEMIGSRFRDEAGIHPYISLEKLLQSKLKPKDEKTIKDIDKPYADVKGLVRSFVSSFASVNGQLLDDTRPILEEAETEYTRAFEKIQSEKGGPVVFAEILEAPHPNAVGRSIVPKAIDRLFSDRSKWQGLGLVSRSAHSGRVVSQTDTYYGSDKKLWTD